jgi:RNA polymerase sigma factor (sigma-70 family)
MRLAAAAARRYRGRRLDYDDRLSAAYEGLLAAAAGFDPTRGLAFSTYATTVMRRHIAHAAWLDRTIRLPLHLKRKLADPDALAARPCRGRPMLERARRALSTTSLSLLDPGSEPGALDPALGDGEADPAARAAALLGRLCPEERAMVEDWMYGTAYAEIGRRIGRNKETVRVRFQRIFARLRLSED